MVFILLFIFPVLHNTLFNCAFLYFMFLLKLCADYVEGNAVFLHFQLLFHALEKNLPIFIIQLRYYLMSTIISLVCALFLSRCSYIPFTTFNRTRCRANCSLKYSQTGFLFTAIFQIIYYATVNSEKQSKYCKISGNSPYLRFVIVSMVTRQVLAFSLIHF